MSAPFAAGRRGPPERGPFAAGRRVADAVLYEGYVLYPYRASSDKNRVRWQFGVLAPRAWSEAGGCESWWSQTECLIESREPPCVEGQVRFLQPRPRRLEVMRAGRRERVASLERDGVLHTSFEEGVERELGFASAAGEDPRARPFSFAEPELREALGAEAWQVRDGVAVSGCVQLSWSRAGDALWRLRVRVENGTHWRRPEAPRAEALAAGMVGVHCLLALRDGRFLSLTDPPEAAAEAARRCENVRTWPVLLGPDDGRGGATLLLSSPIILPDRPEVAPESTGDFFDATEIDEMLSLRVHTLTPDEQREAAATDPRAAEIVARCQELPAEALERMHGALRIWRELAVPAEAPPAEAEAPGWRELFDGPHPEDDSLEVAGVRLRRGSRVRLRPKRRADAQDLFLEGQIARVEGVFRDVDGGRYLGVIPVQDGAEELFRWHGRYFYFHPDEVEPLTEVSR